MSVALTVVGSINLDFVATAATLPAPGETVTGATLARHPGGKGANQALAARRLGAAVQLIGATGKDGMADEALGLLRRDGVDLWGVATRPELATGVALIAVSAEGENQIIVAPGANAGVLPGDLPNTLEGAVILQLELPIPTVAAAAERATGFVAVNLAPAAVVPQTLLDRADLLVVNETEAAFYGESLHQSPGLVAVTLGGAGAKLFKDGVEIAAAAPPPVTVVDTTGAGDCFVAALAVALLEGQPPKDALAFACTAGALAVTRAGAQPSLPTRAEVDAALAGA
ncbi:ribokinase [Caulobacter sp. NIBR1757]|uniref:ribokinase n=1 Tax=Caulobacter sp. NIBR1757 TaxID=3016000 RepID=UPI0022F08ECB|nr:ribokinase [Caulobacter sp. NIBR1757]WGM40378.1 Ribokinase [Caulobacter sp. NIBR1757]